jgi:hypothetical protein
MNLIQVKKIEDYVYFIYIPCILLYSFINFLYLFIFWNKKHKIELIIGKSCQISKRVS